MVFCFVFFLLALLGEQCRTSVLPAFKLFTDVLLPQILVCSSSRIIKSTKSFSVFTVQSRAPQVDSSSEKPSCSPLCDNEVLPLIQEGFKRVYLAHDYFEFSQHLQEHLILRFTTFWNSTFWDKQLSRNRRDMKNWKVSTNNLNFRQITAVVSLGKEAHLSAKAELTCGP